MNSTTPRFSDASDFIIGASRVGQVFATYSQLVEALGQPHGSRAAGDSLDKISVFWAIRTCEGILFLHDCTNYGATATGEQWWQIGSHPQGHEQKPIHPVVALVGSLTGCEVRDARPFCWGGTR